jgi:hypothetical protein
MILIVGGKCLLGVHIVEKVESELTAKFRRTAIETDE